jgi:hypothetical protein
MYAPIIKVAQILYTCTVDHKNQPFKAELYLTHADLFVPIHGSLATIRKATEALLTDHSQVHLSQDLSRGQVRCKNERIRKGQAHLP